MHDGRAGRDFKAAISFHGGEAAGSRNRFQKLTKKDQDDLVAFLKSL